MSALTKPLPHVVTGLIDKRCEIAGGIAHVQAQMRQTVADLDNIEAALRIGRAAMVDCRHPQRFTSYDAPLIGN
jgi:stage III sporulation protein SpoIIIAA